MVKPELVFPPYCLLDLGPVTVSELVSNLDQVVVSFPGEEFGLLCGLREVHVFKGILVQSYLIPYQGRSFKVEVDILLGLVDFSLDF
jgi:hypothetical protein